MTLAAVAVSQLDHLNLTVRSLADSLRFYREMFGFTVVESRLEEAPHPWSIVRSGSAMLCLYEHTKLRTSPRFPEAPDVQEVRHFALRIQDGAGFEHLCESQGISLLYGGPVRWKHSTSYYLEDPTGHQIEVVAWDGDEIQFDSDESGRGREMY